MRSLLIPLLILPTLFPILAFRVPSNSHGSEPDLGSINPPLPLPLTTKHETAIVAAPDGTVHLVEMESGKVLWSFSSGKSIYSSYQLIPKHEGEKLNSTSIDEDNFYIDCGDDWELYLHGKGLRKVKLPLGAEEFVKRTPFVSGGGGVMLGSKKTSVFLVDAETGKVVRSFRTDNLPSSFEFNADEASSFMTTEIEEWLPSSSMTSDSLEKPLYITRTDYVLSYTSVKTGKVLWYLMFADIEASFHCDGIENFFGNIPDDHKLRKKQGLDGKLPLNCHTRPVVYRIRDRGSLESLFIGDGLQDAALPGKGQLSLPNSDQQDMETAENSLALRSNKEVMVALTELMDRKLDRGYSDQREILLALPSSEHKEMITRSPDDNTAPQVNPPVESLTLAQLYYWPFLVCSGLGAVALTCVCFIRDLFIRGSSKLHTQPRDLKLQTVAPRKKKVRKSVTKKQIVVSMGISEQSHENENYVEERRLGKLVVTNKEIAKGSNGTVVLEGNYDGRFVAVKRLVRTHHSVAAKEIQNLIASDQHPNIVRWYGVEYDQDFVYLCLERCTCSLHDLISLSASTNKYSGTNSDDHQSIESMRTLGTEKELEFWKLNGYPSPLLVKLLRDIVCGLTHMHELGIVHRDLKPQNVLVIKDRSVVSAKISDMGISKHLDGDMSSLTKHLSGHGSPGWQAPEQLRGLRQTRAVDLFSLGCIFFFCITGGKHPFGDSLERDVNIVNNRKDLFLVDHIPEASDIISQLLDPSPELRPKAAETMQHPLFWNSEMRLSFLRDASDRVELEDREKGSELLEALEKRGKFCLGGRWDEKMDSVFIQDLGRYRRYKYDSVRDLLRVIRNKLNHFRELPKEVQGVLGSVPDGFDSYFSIRFPRLLIEVYRVILKYCADEEIFQKYFRST